ncbi:MAG: hypothetical protein ACYDHH_22445 [Solirubrobacteraceae bacterium]
MPERERPQRRGRRDPAAQQPTRAARPQDLSIVDAVRPERHRVDKRDDLAASVGRAGPVAAQPHQLLRQRLNPKPLRERGDQRHASIRNDPLVVEDDPQPIQSDRLVIVHHQGDLLPPGPGCPYSHKGPAQEVILHSGPDGTRLPNRWIRASYQDDMQWMRSDPELPERVSSLFERLPDAAQVSTVFYKAVLRNIRSRLKSIEGVGCYHVRPYGMADTGFVRLALVEEEGFRFHGTEGTTSEFWLERGYRVYALHAPHLAWLPHPSLVAELIGSPRQTYYLSPLDEHESARLTAAPLGEIPFHEDWCLPWGWRALRPFWFTGYSAEYPSMVLESLRRRQVAWPR